MHSHTAAKAGVRMGQKYLNKNPKSIYVYIRSKDDHADISEKVGVFLGVR